MSTVDSSGATGWRATLRIIRSYLTRHPSAVIIAGAVLVSAVVTGSLWGEDATSWGTGPTALASGNWWTPITALIVPDSTIETVLAVVLLLTVFAYAETLLGHLRVAVLFVATGLVSVAVATGVHAALWSIVDLRPWETTDPVLDPSIGIFGATMAASAFASALWRRRLRTVGFAVLVMFAFYAGDADSWYRLVAGLVGFVVGVLMAGRPRLEWHRSSTREIRSLMAALVAVTGLGPVAAVIAGGGRGPFSLVASSFVEYDQHLVDRCVAVYSRGCDHQFALLVTRGAGPVILALVPLALLIVAAIGIRRGRRAGALLAVVVQVLLAAVAIYSWASGELSIDSWADGTGLEYVLWAAASIGVPLVTAGTIILLRRRFSVRATPAAAHTFVVTAVLAFVLCVTVFMGSEWLLRRSFDVAPSVLDLLTEALRRFIPPAFLQGVGQPPYPRQGPALWVYQWVGVVFWAIIIVALLRLSRSVRGPVNDDGRLYRDLLRRGGGTLGFLGTWRGTSYWYSPDRSSAVAFRLVGDVALALGDPLTPPGGEDRAIRGFIDHCTDAGWVPVFYSIHDAQLPVFDRIGWQYVSVGEETVMVVSEVTLTGKQWQKVRQPMTRAEREGITAVWTRWADLTASQRAQVREIDEQWVADKALPEMGFTLGSLDEVTDPDVALLLAVDAEERVQVVTSWMPSWRDGALTGWTLDFMRRRADGPNGLMEFVIARAAQRAAADGIEEVSLSGAPMAVKPDAEVSGDPTTLRGVLSWLAETLEPAYGFASLFRFKRKFHPHYRTIWLAYGDPVDLPKIGIAIGRAYLPDATPADVLTLLRSARGGDR
ncbi:DUF2156 domain-containing protein [Microbacterium sp. cx-55]|uniref:bifunctional lysylphosphatidylglycerol flippase/synthetase MprF n=1 Tax=Microbacterium sp. cx-55 TaxID=2875948 RepID=UPI001CBCC6F0|nr:DUF2156 domain-containing protein [Microbacterium sp. cx-55]MBZ4488712.1 DUF2156 domain-containing protein [Microbacterium sp. cx-55]UGB36049.1 DUF2156 domain-containing protein [Microbacterium sp. cx-55]